MNKLEQHRENQIKHALKRAKERYDVDFEMDDLVEIRKIIVQNRHIREDFTLGNHRRCEVKYKEKNFWVIYSLETNMVATFLPYENCRRTFN